MQSYAGSAADWCLESLSRGSHLAVGEQHHDTAVASMMTDVIASAPAGTTFVVEWLTRGAQDSIDAFVSGAELGLADVAHAWRDTTQHPSTFHWAGYVQALLAARSRAGAVRLWGGEPHVPWGAVRSADDLMPYAAMRDTHAADLAHQAAATSPVVLWYGTWHVARGFGGVVDLLERHGLVFKVAFVRPNEEEVVHLDASSLTVGDVLGLPDSRMASEVCDVLLAPKPQLLTVAPSDLPVPDVFEERRRTALINGMLDRLRSTPTS